MKFMTKFKTQIFVILSLAIFLSPISVFAQEKSVQHFNELLSSVGQAEGNGDFDKGISSLNECLELAPNYPFLYYYLAWLEIGKTDVGNAASAFEKALELGYDCGDELAEPFVPYKGSSEFVNVLKMIDKLKTPIKTSIVATTISEKDLIPEGITYDPVDKVFYLSSIHKSKIIKFDLQGNYSDFTSERQDGLGSVLGLKVDAKRRILWAASEISSVKKGMTEAEVGWSGLYKYDLQTGKLIKKYVLHEEGVLHLFNDIAISDSGDVYLTDSEYGSIYLVDNKRDKLELFIKDEAFYEPNGITFGLNQDTLYMASSRNAVFKISVGSKKVQALAFPDNVSLVGMDGISLYGKSLVCVQNGLNRVSRLYLSEAGDVVEKLVVLETRNPHFKIPTTGTIVGDNYYYIANSQMTAYDREGKILPEDQLDDVVILETKLKPGS